MNAAEPDFAGWVRAHRVRWETWLDGYARGIQHGIDLGREQANQEWTDTTTAACRAGLVLTARKDVETRRIATRSEALTGEQIREQAARSWDLQTVDASDRTAA